MFGEMPFGRCTAVAAACVAALAAAVCAGTVARCAADLRHLVGPHIALFVVLAAAAAVWVALAELLAAPLLLVALAAVALNLLVTGRDLFAAAAVAEVVDLESDTDFVDVALDMLRLKIISFN